MLERTISQILLGALPAVFRPDSGAVFNDLLVPSQWTLLEAFKHFTEIAGKKNKSVSKARKIQLTRSLEAVVDEPASCRLAGSSKHGAGFTEDKG